MSSVNAVSKVHSSKKSIGLVGLLLLSSLGALSLAPNASASVSGDYEITNSISPRPEVYLSSWEPVYFEVQVSNPGFFFNSQPRSIEMFVCEGVQDETSCYNDREEFASAAIDPIPTGGVVNYSFATIFYPDGAEGAHTIVYRFVDSDSNPTNDVGIYQFYLTTKLVDVEFDEQNPISQLSGLAEYNGELILNTETDYIMDISGTVKSCGVCGLEADIGWKLVDSQGVEQANSTITYSNLPDWGIVAFSRQMPSLNFDTEGTYTMYFGILNSTGTPSGDMNSFNDLQSVEVIFDDTVDLQITSMYPRSSPTSPNYFYGKNSVSVTVSNLGNHTVAQPLVRFTVSDLSEEVDSVEDCVPEEIIPGQSVICIFDLEHLGDKKLNVFVSEALNEGLDAKPSDNVLNVQAQVIAGDINPIIEQTNQNSTYSTADNITFTVRTDSTAASPLSYTWWASGIIPLGSGFEITVPASAVGLGDHFISVRVTDSLGYLESTTTSITVFNSTDISSGNWLTGSAVTRTHAEGVATYDYPIAGLNYGPGTGLEALIRISIDVLPTTEEPTAGMDWMNFDLNLTELLPDNVPRESIAIHQLTGYDEADWDPLDTDDFFTLIDNDTLRVQLTENMDLLLVGELPAPDIDLSNPILTKLPDGKMRLDWNATGDIGNPYFGGWNIYRITSTVSAATYFPDPAESSSQFLWNGLMENSLSASLDGTVSHWVDERELETGICSSYAIIPTDRTGNPNYLAAKVSLNEGIPGLTCGDAIDPNSEVSGFSSSVVYNNDTDCFEMYLDWNRCYEVTLSWTWPDNEPDGEIYWNLYRIEHRPGDIDLRYIDPIVSGLQNVPGEKGTFTQTGMENNGVAPYRTYYYILTPLDVIGNERTEIQYPSENIERVYIQEQYWNYNEHLIPEPPPPEEPPYGVEWLGDLEDYMQIENFQIAGLVMLLTIIINFVGLPIVLKKRNRMKRKLAKRANKQSDDLDEDFQDFFN